MRDKFDSWWLYAHLLICDIQRIGKQKRFFLASIAGGIIAFILMIGAVVTSAQGSHQYDGELIMTDGTRYNLSIQTSTPSNPPNPTKTSTPEPPLCPSVMSIEVYTIDGVFVTAVEDGGAITIPSDIKHSAIIHTTDDVEAVGIDLFGNAEGQYVLFNSQWERQRPFTLMGDVDGAFEDGEYFEAGLWRIGTAASRGDGGVFERCTFDFEVIDATN